MELWPENPVETNPQRTALLAGATPDLYRVNVFRILNLPVTATVEDVAARESRLELMAKVGGARQTRQAGCLPLDPPPDSQAIHQAARRFLEDPFARLFDVLFWFWPVDPRGDTDDALELLQTGNPHGAARRWTAMAREPARRAAARHNLAVLHHVLALDLERAGASTPLPRKIATQRDHYWTESYQNWHAVAEDELFWQAVACRAEGMADLRANPDLAPLLRQVLPTGILNIGAQLAVQAAEAHRPDDLRRHVSALRHSGFPPRLVTASLEGQMVPHVTRIKALADSLVAQSTAIPEAANDLAATFATDARPLLAVGEAVLGDQHPWCQAAHDAAAGALRQCAWDFGNATQRWPEGMALIAAASGLARSSALQAQLNKDAADIQQRIDDEANRAASDLVRQANHAAEQRDFVLTERLLHEAFRLCKDPHEKSLIAGRLDLARSAAAPGAPAAIAQSKGPSRPFLIAVAVILAAGLTFIVAEVFYQASWANKPEAVNNPSVTPGQAPQDVLTPLPSPVPPGPGIATAPFGASPAPPAPPVEQSPAPDSGLLAQIEAGKARAAELVTEIQKMDEQLKTWSAQIEAGEAAIRDFTDRVGRSLPVDRAAFEQTVKDHNDLVTRFNALAAEHRTKAAQYMDLIKSVNDMVVRYNRGQR